MSQPSLAAPARAERRDDRNFGLDLARFLAMALVLVQHASSMFMGIVGLQPAFVVLMFSFYGVELFFVLSGFLIGRLLFRIAETDATPRGWLVFMVRRWLRTLPLYYVWLVVVLLLVPPGTDPMGHLLRYAAMAQNIAWPMPADHWYNESWSLVSEEWFYLLFAAALIGAFIVVPLLARILHPAPANFQDQIYHVALYRLDAIAYGVALAKLHQQNSRLFRYPWLAFGICAVLVTVHLVGLGVPINSVWFGIVFRQVFGLLWGISIALCLFLVAVLPLR
jgi:peptidoglycan/LPS O-acetylase OafA/YrhL